MLIGFEYSVMHDYDLIYNNEVDSYELMPDFFSI